jgi:hypothetical protein
MLIIAQRSQSLGQQGHHPLLDLLQTDQSRMIHAKNLSQLEPI